MNLSPRYKSCHCKSCYCDLSDLVKQLSVMKPGGSVVLSENDKARMMEGAQRIVQEMRRTGYTAERDNTFREQDEAHACEKPSINLPVALCSTWMK